MKGGESNFNFNDFQEWWSRHPLRYCRTRYLLILLKVRRPSVWPSQPVRWKTQLHKVSDFVRNSYGETWDSSCEKSRVVVQNYWVPVQKPESLGLYVTTQLIKRQTSKHCITVYWNKNTVYSFYYQAQQRLKEICTRQSQKSHKQDILQKYLQIDQSIFASFGTHTTKRIPSSRYECVFCKFSHKRVGVALPATVETLYEK